MTTPNMIICGAGLPDTISHCGNEREEIDICKNCKCCTYSGCCECWTCNTCQNMFSASTPPCASCNGCPTDCRCMPCAACGVRQNRDYMHATARAPRVGLGLGTAPIAPCNRCETCCFCFRPPPRIEHIAPAKTIRFWEATKGVRSVNTSKRFIAAEIEVANIGPTGMAVSNIIREWGGAVVRDGSIRGDCPFEINTSPAAGDMYIKQIDKICGALRQSEAEVNSSCGLHVHVDARDFRFYDIRKLAILYSKLEDGLFAIVAPSRKASKYCAPCGKKYVRDLENGIVPKDEKSNEKTLIKNIYGHDDTIANIKANGKYQDARYAAMNFHSWIFRGTIENRMHQGTLSAKKIKVWGMLNAGIVDFAFDNSEKYIRGIKGDPLQVLLDTAPSNEIRDWVSARALKFKAGLTDENGETDKEDVTP